MTYEKERDTIVLRRTRVLAAKPGLDGHDRGIKVVCNALKDAGMEVIYTGLRQTPEQIVRAAFDEDVDVIALSILSGAHNYYLPKVAELLKQKQTDTILLLAGGIIPRDDIAKLKERGIHEIFGPGTSTETIVKYIRENLSPIRHSSTSSQGE
jgi:methylmalonyl-CoA mutase C-terminal domain/subunit